MDLDIFRVWNAIKQRLWIVILSVLVVASITGWISYYVIKPVFEGKTKILIQSQTASNRDIYNDVLTNQKLVTTYSEIIESNRITEDVINRLNLSMSTVELLKKVTTKSNEDSLITTIIVRDHDAQRAVDIANTYAVSFYENINSIIRIDNVSVLDVAKLPPNPIPVLPKPILNISISIFLTFIFGILLILVYESMDNRIKEEEDLEKVMEIPMLGVIPRFDRKIEK